VWRPDRGLERLSDEEKIERGRGRKKPWIVCLTRKEGILEAISPEEARFPKGEDEKDDPTPLVDEKGGSTTGQISKNPRKKRWPDQTRETRSPKGDFEKYTTLYRRLIIIIIIMYFILYLVAPFPYE
jgi:hypothetical protein